MLRRCSRASVAKSVADRRLLDHDAATGGPLELDDQRARATVISGDQGRRATLTRGLSAGRRVSENLRDSRRIHADDCPLIFAACTRKSSLADDGQTVIDTG